MTYTNINEIPLVVDAACLKDILGISRSMTYAVMRSKGCPTFRLGKRVLLHRDELFDWIRKQSGHRIVSQTDLFQAVKKQKF